MSANGIDWSTLTSADKAVLLSLGIAEPSLKEKRVKPSQNPITLERRMATRNTCPAEYYVKLLSYCNCCKTYDTIYGKMTRLKLSDNCLHLVIQDIPENEIFRQLRLTSVNCAQCDDVLGKLSNEELIKMIKGLHDVCAKKCMP